MASQPRPAGRPPAAVDAQPAQPAPVLLRRPAPRRAGLPCQAERLPRQAGLAAHWQEGEHPRQRLGWLTRRQAELAPHLAVQLQLSRCLVVGELLSTKGHARRALREWFGPAAQRNDTQQANTRRWCSDGAAAAAAAAALDPLHTHRAPDGHLVLEDPINLLPLLLAQLVVAQQPGSKQR